MAADEPAALLLVGSLDELKAKRLVVVRGGRCPILVGWHDGKIFAVDNRCPHLGFPLHRGSVDDGILTCHWHHARFDVESGGAFDLWADDLATAKTVLRGSEVWVSSTLEHADRDAHWRNRLRDGLSHDLPLVIAKALLGLRAMGTEDRDLLREAALFAVRHRDAWGSGLTILTALANLLPMLPPEDVYLALYSGLRQVAEDCRAAPAPRRTKPLGDEPRSMRDLGAWLRHWTKVRHRTGGERILLTAIAGGAPQHALAELLLVAATDRAFADGGHTLDFINKAFECLDLIGWSHAGEVLPSVMAHLVAAQGAEESNAWRHPIDLIQLCEAAFERLPGLAAQGAARRGLWRKHSEFAQELLGDDPAAIVEAIAAAIADGAAQTDLSLALAYASALRVARFGTANEHSDWLRAHHSFTYCNALHQMLKRVSAPDASPQLGDALGYRGIFHGAMQNYLLRFLNVPPAPIQGRENGAQENPTREPEAICRALLEAMDRRGSVDEAAQLVARYLALRAPHGPLVAALCHSVLREDADFHTYQMLEAGICQYREWAGARPGDDILVALARFLAAHAPTERSQLQTAVVARRLHRGELLHESEPSPVE